MTAFSAAFFAFDESGNGVLSADEVRIHIARTQARHPRRAHTCTHSPRSHRCRLRRVRRTDASALVQAQGRGLAQGSGRAASDATNRCEPREPPCERHHRPGFTRCRCASKRLADAPANPADHAPAASRTVHCVGDLTRCTARIHGGCVVDPAGGRRVLTGSDPRRGLPGRSCVPVHDERPGCGRSLTDPQ